MKQDKQRHPGTYKIRSNKAGISDEIRLIALRWASYWIDVPHYRHKRDLNISQRDMAKQLGLSGQGIVWYYLAGYRHIPESLLVAAHRRGANLNWVFTGAGDKYRSRSGTKSRSSY